MKKFLKYSALTLFVLFCLYGWVLALVSLRSSSGFYTEHEAIAWQYGYIEGAIETKNGDGIIPRALCLAYPAIDKDASKLIGWDVDRSIFDSNREAREACELFDKLKNLGKVQ